MEASDSWLPAETCDSWLVMFTPELFPIDCWMIYSYPSLLDYLYLLDDLKKHILDYLYLLLDYLQLFSGIIQVIYWMI